ncbi:MAG: peptidoglycan-binding protein [Ignavibacteria bacterium]|nr:peptidoglycan-binding protein [Ignavibacteria bacterium]
MKVPSEYEIILPLKSGSKGRDVRIAQEWLCLHDCHIPIDGYFAPATEAAVRKFQTKIRLPASGIIDELTFRALIAPITRACRQLDTTAEMFSQRVVAAARQHLKEHPREIGGQHFGPWVRLYTRGKEGSHAEWSSGFVSTLILQAQEGLKNVPNAIQGSLSCTGLAQQAQSLDMFVTERLVADGIVKHSDLGPGTVFLQRSSESHTEWMHTGIVVVFHPEFMETIEGNSQYEEGSEGYEVCRMLRGYKNIDFIKL